MMNSRDYNTLKGGAKLYVATSVITFSIQMISYFIVGLVMLFIYLVTIGEGPKPLTNEAEKEKLNTRCRRICFLILGLLMVMGGFYLPPEIILRWGTNVFSTYFLTISSFVLVSIIIIGYELHLMDIDKKRGVKKSRPQAQRKNINYDDYDWRG